MAGEPAEGSGPVKGAALVLLLAAPAAAAPAPLPGIFGLTVAGGFEGAVATAAAAGFKSAVISANREHLDVLEKAGMKGVVALWLDPEGAKDPEKWAKFLARVDRDVSALKGHPALAAWYLADEPDGEGVPVGKLRELADRVRAADAKTPRMAVFNKPSRWARYFPCVDVVAIDPYLRRRPLRGDYEPVSVVREWVAKAKDDVAAAGTPKPVWAVLGAFELKPKDGRPSGYRKPSPEELLAMAADARRAGAEGVLVYTYAVAGRWRLADDDPALWKAASRLGEGE